MVAPARSRWPVTRCICASEIGEAGIGISAEAPPEITQISRSRSPQSPAMSCNAPRTFQAAVVRNRMAGFVKRDAAQANSTGVLHIHETPGDAAAEQTFHRAAHRRTGLPCPDHLNAIEFRKPVAAPLRDQRLPSSRRCRATAFPASAACRAARKIRSACFPPSVACRRAVIPFSPPSQSGFRYSEPRQSWRGAH